jgi:AbrB family transcriptional regulator (stage V sporulation protein T)
VATQDENNFVRITMDDSGTYKTQAISTIICQGDAIGAVILYDKNQEQPMGETENQLVLTAAGFLGKQMEQ